MRNVNQIHKVGLLLLELAALTLLVGFLDQHGTLYLGHLVEDLLHDYYANISTELASIAVVVLIIDKLYQRREMEQEKRDLSIRMGSGDNALAREAVHKLRVGGWLDDGTLSYAYLEGANLHEADLSGATLSRAILRKADLTGAILCRADLAEADLRRANLTGVDLSKFGSTLSDHGPRSGLWKYDLYRDKVPGDVFGVADLHKADLRGANLTDARLDGANLREANLRGANLTRAKLVGVDLSRADLRWANLTGTDLNATNLNKVRLHGAVLDQTTQIDAKWRLVWEIATRGASDLDLREADLRRAWLAHADLHGADLTEGDLRGVNLAWADLTGAFLREADLRGADLGEANLRGADLRGANLNWANLTGADLTGTQLSAATLYEAEVTPEQLSRAKPLEGAIMPDGTKHDWPPACLRRAAEDSLSRTTVRDTITVTIAGLDQLA
jgi:uncharacterized protein YjbI with pentapeptide repeats